MSPSSTLEIHTEQLKNAALAFQLVKVQRGLLLLTETITAELSDFWIGTYPITQDLWHAVMGENPSYFQGARRPVENVNWYDCIEFCNALSERQELEPVYTVDKSQQDPNNTNENDNQKWLVTANHSATGYRLPTEAEWEYAARGGRHTRGFEYAGSDDLDEVGWYDDNSLRATWPVGQKRPNELGIYDMSGNVREWCWDWYADYPTAYKDAYMGPMKNPKGHISGEYRVLRGGSWINNPDYCRVDLRSFNWPLYRNLNSAVFVSPGRALWEGISF